MQWQGHLRNNTDPTGRDIVTSASAVARSDMLERAAEAMGEAGKANESIPAAEAACDQIQHQAVTTCHGATEVPSAKRAVLPRSCRKPAPPARTTESLFEPLPSRPTLPRAPYQLVAYSVHAPVQRLQLSTDRARSDLSSTELRYLIMGKSKAAAAHPLSACDPCQVMPEVPQHERGDANEDGPSLHADVEAGPRSQKHPSARMHCQVQVVCLGAKDDPVVPSSTSRAASCAANHYVCSVCGVETAKVDMTARSHCKSCSQLCTQLRSRYGKLKYLQAAYQQLGNSADNSEVLKLATQLVHSEARPGRNHTGVENTHEAGKQSASVPHTTLHLHPCSKQEAAEQMCNVRDAVPDNVHGTCAKHMAAKRRSGKSANSMRLNGHAHTGKALKVKTEVCGTIETTRQAGDAAVSVPPSSAMQDLSCSVCGCKVKAEKRKSCTPTLCTSCVDCYLRAREQSYTVLELKNAVTGGYVVPKENPSALEIRSAISRMLLGQPKAKAGGGRSCRAARRMCPSAPARSDVLERGQAEEREPGCGLANDQRPRNASCEGERHHVSAPERNGNCHGHRKNVEGPAPVPNIAASVPAVASGGTSHGSDPVVVHAFQAQSRGVVAAADVAAAGSGTSATATGLAKGINDADVHAGQLPDQLPPVWERQISSMIQDAVNQQGVDNSVLIECITRNANDVARAVFNSTFAQSSAPWMDRSADCGQLHTQMGSGIASQYPGKTCTGQVKRKSWLHSEMTPGGDRDSQCGKHARTAAFESTQEGAIHAAVQALGMEGIDVNDEVDRILRVSVPAVQAYLHSAQAT
eukprot:jgi/Ulvmu1/6243/UM028_0101.1